jgi:hypothetical protein
LPKVQPNKRSLRCEAGFLLCEVSVTLEPLADYEQDFTYPTNLQSGIATIAKGRLTRL